MSKSPQAGSRMPIAVTSRSAATADLRIVCISRVLAVAVFFHAIQWIRRSTGHYTGLGLDGFIRQPEVFSSASGVAFSNEFHLLVNWGLFIGIAIYLLVGVHIKSAMVLLFVVGISHFLGLVPRVQNHYLVLLIAIGIVALAPHTSRSLPRARSPISAGPPLAIVLIRHLCCLTYFFAFFHKLNSSFLSPDTSSLRDLIPTSAVTLFTTPLSMIGIGEAEARADIGYSALILYALVMELSIPILLMCRRTRFAGWISGFVFHGLIILSAGVIDYTPVILGLYTAFLDTDELNALIAALKQSRPYKVCGAVFVAGLLLAPPFVLRTQRMPLPDIATKVAWGVEVFAALALLAAIVYIVWTIFELRPLDSHGGGTVSKNATQRNHRMVRRVSTVGVILFLDALYIGNCLGPYLGVKYWYSQAMFSGLAVDGSNHILMPPIRVAVKCKYVQVTSLELSRPLTDIERRTNRGLNSLLERYENELVEWNFLASVLDHTCANTDLRVSITFVPDDSESRTVTWSNVRDHRQHLSYHPFNLYPWFVQGRTGHVTTHRPRKQQSRGPY